MRKLLLFSIFLSLASPVAAQVSAPTSIDIQDEGTSQGRIRAINCVGSGVTCTASSSTGTLTIGGGSAGNFLEVSVDLGTSGGLVFSLTVTGQSWVTGTSKVVCNTFSTAADGQTVETAYAAGFSVNVSTLVVSTGFDIGIYNPHGATGIFRFHCSGA